MNSQKKKKINSVALCEYSVGSPNLDALLALPSQGLVEVKFSPSGGFQYSLHLLAQPCFYIRFKRKILFKKEKKEKISTNKNRNQIWHRAYHATPNCFIPTLCCSTTLCNNFYSQILRTEIYAVILVHVKRFQMGIHRLRVQVPSV